MYLHSIRRRSPLVSLMLLQTLSLQLLLWIYVQGCLCSDWLWNIQTVSPFGAEEEFVHCPV